MQKNELKPEQPNQQKPQKKIQVARETELSSHELFLNKSRLKAILKYDLE